MLGSILGSLRVISIPTKTNFRSVQHREFALFEGPQGWGEFSPFLEYSPRECVPWLVSGVEAAVVAAPSAKRTEIDINATLPCVNGREKIAEILSWFSGCKTVKIKVGNDLQEDLIRIATVREILPEARIRIDVNGLWTVSDALEALRAIHAEGDIEFVEQPCATVEELRALKKELDVPVQIAGDEIVRKSSNPLAIDLNGAIDVLLLKVAPLGGIKRSMEIASTHHLPVVVSSALDSAVGISYGLKLAAALPRLDFACGLGTGQLLADDIGALPIKNGKIEVQTVVPSHSALRKHEVSSDRLGWWRDRILQTWDAGASQWVASEGWHW